ncbi:MAG: trypsin-like peptidase domain-containing protein [Desulfobacterales bacterium]|nr:trypsin-like peptidase domain-containing protein [Desulfobacterales bacterium]
MSRYQKMAIIAGLLTVIIGSIALAGFAATPPQIYQKAGPAVVFIMAKGNPSMNHIGTGSIISGDGLVLTNAHIFSDPESSRVETNIKVYLKPHRITGNNRKDLTHRYRGRLLAHDIALDLALIQIEQLDRSLPWIAFADSERVVVGDPVFAIGHPEQGGLWSLTSGVISAFRQDHDGIRGKNLFQTDASINRGNSGGPLLDINGDMVGINSLIARKAPDGLTITDVNYSIMSNVARSWLMEMGYHFPVSRTESSGSNKKSANISGGIKDSTPDYRVKPEHPVQPSKPLEEDRPPPSTRTKSPTARDRSRENTHPIPGDVPGNKSDQPGYRPDPPITKGSPEKTGPRGMAEDRILSPKRPYEIGQLLRDMQEMEDLMEDMRGKVMQHKTNR